VQCDITVDVRIIWVSLPLMAFRSQTGALNAQVAIDHVFRRRGVAVEARVKGSFRTFEISRTVNALVNFIVLFHLPLQFTQMVALYLLGIVSEIYRRARRTRLNAYNHFQHAISRTIMAETSFRGIVGGVFKGRISGVGLTPQGLHDHISDLFHEEVKNGLVTTEELNSMAALTFKHLDSGNKGLITCSDFVKSLSTHEFFDVRMMARFFSSSTSRSVFQNLLDSSHRRQNQSLANQEVYSVMGRLDEEAARSQMLRSSCCSAPMHISPVLSSVVPDDQCSSQQRHSLETVIRPHANCEGDNVQQCIEALETFQKEHAETEAATSSRLCKLDSIVAEGRRILELQILELQQQQQQQQQALEELQQTYAYHTPQEAPPDDMALGETKRGSTSSHASSATSAPMASRVYERLQAVEVRLTKLETDMLLGPMAITTHGGVDEPSASIGSVLADVVPASLRPSLLLLDRDRNMTETGESDSAAVDKAADAGFALGAKVPSGTDITEGSSPSRRWPPLSPSSSDAEDTASPLPGRAMTLDMLAGRPHSRPQPSVRSRSSGACTPSCQASNSSSRGWGKVSIPDVVAAPTSGTGRPWRRGCSPRSDTAPSGSLLRLNAALTPSSRTVGKPLGPSLQLGHADVDELRQHLEDGCSQSSRPEKPHHPGSWSSGSPSFGTHVGKRRYFV